MKYSVCSVTQVNEHIRDLLDADVTLGALFVRGEISNYKAYPSGHHYFSLKDEGGSLRCVMFRREAATLRFRPQNGMKVVAFGRVSAYPRDGQYQLYVSALQADGVGDLHAAFEELKARLAAQCLFDPEHKKPIPRFPKRIALVTSPAGAAVRDMIRILGARWPMAEVFVVPCRVQGAEAPPEIAGAIAWVDQHDLADLIITGRGGGSMEDLWCFNGRLCGRPSGRHPLQRGRAGGTRPERAVCLLVPVEPPDGPGGGEPALGCPCCAGAGGAEPAAPGSHDLGERPPAAAGPLPGGSDPGGCP